MDFALTVIQIQGCVHTWTKNAADVKALHKETEQYICLISEGSIPVAMTTNEIEKSFIGGW